jgi:hypothetical protein
MSDEDGMTLVMPFVVVASEGGPYDDEAFTAGWEMGSLDATLRYNRAHFLRLPLRTASMDQVDLIAMKHGYTIRHHVMPEDEWTEVEFTRTAP